MRRTSVLRSKTLAQGRIHFARAGQNEGSPQNPRFCGEDAVAATLILESYLVKKRLGRG